MLDELKLKGDGGGRRGNTGNSPTLVGAKTRPPVVERPCARASTAGHARPVFEAFTEVFLAARPRSSPQRYYACDQRAGSCGLGVRGCRCHPPADRSRSFHAAAGKAAADAGCRRCKEINCRVLALGMESCRKWIVPSGRATPFVTSKALLSQSQRLDARRRGVPAKCS